MFSFGLLHAGLMQARRQQDGRQFCTLPTKENILAFPFLASARLQDPLPRQRWPRPPPGRRHPEVPRAGPGGAGVGRAAAGAPVPQEVAAGAVEAAAIQHGAGTETHDYRTFQSRSWASTNTQTAEVQQNDHF